MITAAQIETDPAAFITRCLGHVTAGMYPASRNGYWDLLMRETPPELNRYFQRVDRSAGTERTFVDADHIIPRSVWTLLMPTQLTTDPRYESVLGNLAWRSTVFNQDQNTDLPMIEAVRAESTANPRGSPGWQDWSRNWIEMFTSVKQQEGNPLAGYYVNPHTIDHGGDDLQRFGNSITRGRLRS